MQTQSVKEDDLQKRHRRAGADRRGVLSDVRVLDLGRVAAAPHCALLLASLGAEVIKIERPGLGDDARANAFQYGNGESAYFMQQNWGKKSVCLNLKGEKARGVLERLVASSDVLIENFRPGTMDRLGLGWQRLSELNPRLVMCSISAFGQTGPDARTPGYGAIAEARAGLPEMTGEPDGPPMPTPIPVADMMAASHAFGAICAALYARERSGRGEYIDIALLDCAVEMQDWAFELHLASGGKIVPTRRGLFDQSLVPWGYFKARDGWVCLIVSNDAFWRKLAILMGQPELGSDERYATVAARADRAAEIYEMVGRWVAEHDTADEVVSVLQQADLPADRLRTIPEVVTDPQLQARAMFPKVVHPTLGELTVVNTALKFTHSPAGITGLPPLLGEHSAQVLREVGFPDPEIAELCADGSLYQAPSESAAVSAARTGRS